RVLLQALGRADELLDLRGDLIGLVRCLLEVGPDVVADGAGRASRGAAARPALPAGLAAALARPRRLGLGRLIGLLRRFFRRRWPARLGLRLGHRRDVYRRRLERALFVGRLAVLLRLGLGLGFLALEFFGFGFGFFAVGRLLGLRRGTRVFDLRTTIGGSGHKRLPDNRG